MKNHSKWQSGQALIILVFSMVGLMGITGLTVDGGLAFSDRRHAQNAADTAAIAGAMAKIKAQSANPTADPHPAIIKAALDMAKDNGYTGDITTSTVEVYTCDEVASSCGSPYTGKSDYVQVIITTNIDTTFARVIGIAQMHNRVQAVALAKASGNLYDGDSIIALSTQCENPKNFAVGGTADVTLTGGGLFVNTDAGDGSCGFTCNSSSTSITGSITTAGGGINFGTACDTTNVTQSTSGTSLDFPVTLADMGIKVPPECTSPVGTYKNYDKTYDGSFTPSYTGDDGIYQADQLTVLTPGWYNDFPPQKLISEGKLYNKILMIPGIYCVDHVIKLTDQNLWLIGKDVTFYIRAGYDFSINGGTVQIDAPDSGPYAGYLMIVEPDYGNPLLSKSPLNCNINGGSDNTYEGAIFAPYCNVTITGTSATNSISSQIIAYTVKIDGTGTVNFNYDASKNPKLKARIGEVK